MSRSATARLKAAQDNGAIIVCVCAPYVDRPMFHLPRHSRDGQPWVLATQRHEDNPLRYSGGECKAVTPDGQEAPARKLRPLGEDQKLALDSLRRHGEWPGGWYMTNTSYTIRVLDRLVRRGLVETFEVPSTYAHGSPVTHYRLTQAGLEVTGA
jgi:hypothetical protein